MKKRTPGRACLDLWFTANLRPTTLSAKVEESKPPRAGKGTSWHLLCEAGIAKARGLLCCLCSCPELSRTTFPSYAGSFYSRTAVTTEWLPQPLAPLPGILWMKRLPSAQTRGLPVWGVQLRMWSDCSLDQLQSSRPEDVDKLFGEVWPNSFVLQSKIEKQAHKKHEKGWWRRSPRLDAQTLELNFPFPYQILFFYFSPSLSWEERKPLMHAENNLLRKICSGTLDFLGGRF